ncbi:GH25 family lysozyme [Brachybacterium sp. DNPG3]
MPRYTREQVRRRQLTVLAVGVVVLLVLMGGCVRLLVGGLGGADDASDAGVSGAASDGALAGRTPFAADDAAMSVAAMPEAAAALAQLPDGVELAADEVMGIDVSAHQQEIDWTQVREDGYVFAYIKASEGADFVDERFAENWSGALEAGIVPGAYHYFTLCSSGADQAADFLAAAPPDDAALPPAIDLELDGACTERPEPADVIAEIDDFTAIVEEAWGRRLLIYSSSQWRDAYGLLVGEGRVHWLSSVGSRPEPTDWALWQVRFDGTVSGIDGDVDIDVARIETLRGGSLIPDGEGALTSDDAA